MDGTPIDKKFIVDLLKDKKSRGAYMETVHSYSYLIKQYIGIKAFKKAVEKDLMECTGQSVELKYFSFAKAVERYKKKNQRGENKDNRTSKSEQNHLDKTNRANGAYSTKQKPQYDFKDAHELDDKQRSGSFKISD